jgi:hypothetical protein
VLSSWLLCITVLEIFIHYHFVNNSGLQSMCVSLWAIELKTAFFKFLSYKLVKMLARILVATNFPCSIRTSAWKFDLWIENMSVPYKILLHYKMFFLWQHPLISSNHWFIKIIALSTGILENKDNTSKDTRTSYIRNSILKHTLKDYVGWHKDHSLRY